MVLATPSKSDLPYLTRNPSYRRKFNELVEKFERPMDFFNSPEARKLAREYGLLLPVPPTPIPTRLEPDDHLSMFLPGFLPGGGQAVRLCPPLVLSPLVCALEPSLYLEKGRLLTVKIDLMATDTSIIAELKKQMSRFRAQFSIRQRTQRNKPQYDPLEVWDMVHDLGGKEILTWSAPQNWTIHNERILLR